MTNFERVKNMSVDEIAKSIIIGISSDPCDYCNYAKEYCDGISCEYNNMTPTTEIIKDWLESRYD